MHSNLLPKIPWSIESTGTYYHRSEKTKTMLKDEATKNMLTSASTCNVVYRYNLHIPKPRFIGIEVLNRNFYCEIFRASRNGREILMDCIQIPISHLEMKQR